ncbi:MAG TPA: class I adenylate-forming enzyme family protein [Woeseiaceae bacterium]|nr:class I adenylate-forming enzyme family protein [Woeseiaceae bacterium]
MAVISLLQGLDAIREAGPDRMAIRDSQGPGLTRKQVYSRATRLMRGFQNTGLRPGDPVLFAVRPCADAVVLMIAIVSAGGVLVPLDPHMGDELFAARMSLLAPRWVVAESVLYPIARPGPVRRVFAKLGVRIPLFAALTGVRHIHVGYRLPGVPAGLSTKELERSGAAASAGASVTPSPDDPAMIVFTSGTTDAPKAVVHSWRSMLAVLDITGSMMAATADDVVYARDMHLILPALCSGAMVVMPPATRFSPGRLFRDIKRYHVTLFFGVSSELQQFTDFLNSSEEHVPSCVREIWIGAAPVRQSFLRRFRAVAGNAVRVWCVYGMTEILPIARISLEDKLQYMGRGDPVGACVDGVSARVSEDDELILTGSNLCAGYFGQPPCQELATGDLARIDDDCIVLLGRKKDMIIRGQVNIYPELYEPAVEKIVGVARCALVGIFDPRLADEQVVLVVELEAGNEAVAIESKIQRELRHGGMRIDTSALPDRIVFMQLPISGRSGKVDKRALRERIAGESQCELR